jgi:ribosome-associated translation inhibitor RaiA
MLTPGNNPGLKLPFFLATPHTPKASYLLQVVRDSNQGEFMHVQIHSDSTISMHNKLSDSIGAYITNVLQRFEPYLTRVEVHLTGEANKHSGPRDKRCLLEARPKRHQSLVVSDESTDIETAFSSAAGKLHRHLENTYGRLADKRRRSGKMKERLSRLDPIPSE